MENFNSFESESGYGYNEDGTERSRDDYYADGEYEMEYNDRVERRYRTAEQEERKEYQAIEELQDQEAEERQKRERVRAWTEEARTALARADKLLAAIQAESREYEERKKTVNNLGNSAMGAANNISNRDINMSNARPVPDNLRYVDSQGFVYDNPEDAQGKVA